MDRKKASVISVVVLGFVIAASLVAIILPGWMSYSTTFVEDLAITNNVGPILTCFHANASSDYASGYFGDCSFSGNCAQLTCNSTGYCEQVSCSPQLAAAAFLIIGAVSTVVTLIAIISTAYMKLRNKIYKALNIVSIALHIFTLLCFGISIALVVYVFKESSILQFDGSYVQYQSLGPSFILTAVSEGLVLISIVIYSVFNVFSQNNQNTNYDYSTSSAQLITNSDQPSDQFGLLPEII